MMLRRILLTAAPLVFAATSALAQATPAPARPPKAAQAAAPAKTPTPPPAAAAAPAKPKGQPINVQVEVVFAEHRGGALAPPIKKTVSLVVADSRSGMIRSEARFLGAAGMIPLYVDANPEILPDGKVRLGLNLTYDLPGDEVVGPAGADKTDARRPTTMSIRENASMILESGKSMMVTQSADPVGDRQVTVEVKATILK